MQKSLDRVLSAIVKILLILNDDLECNHAIFFIWFCYVKIEYNDLNGWKNMKGSREILSWLRLKYGLFPFEKFLFYVQVLYNAFLQDLSVCNSFLASVGCLVTTYSIPESCSKLSMYC